MQVQVIALDVAVLNLGCIFMRRAKYRQSGSVLRVVYSLHRKQALNRSQAQDDAAVSILAMVWIIFLCM